MTVTSDPRLVSIMRRTYPQITFLPAERHRREIGRKMPDRTLINDATLFQMLSDEAVIVGREKDLVCSVLDTLADVRPSRHAFLKTKTEKLVPLPDLHKHWRSVLASTGPKLKIGIAWRSMLQSVARNRHYLTVEDLEPLRSALDVEFWLLQPKPTESELNLLSSYVDFRIPSGLDLVDDFEGQLALNACLDGVISPFTTTGELAAAAGTRTVLISMIRSTMWRRNNDGSDLWHSNAQIIAAENGKPAAIEEALEIIRSSVLRESPVA